MKQLLQKNYGCILTSYKCKKNKSDSLLSTLHQSIKFIGEKHKPLTIVDYNKTKFGVDVVDQMARIYSCKLSSHRWPVQVSMHPYAYYTYSSIQYAQLWSFKKPIFIGNFHLYNKLFTKTIACHLPEPNLFVYIYLFFDFRCSVICQIQLE